MSSLLFIGGAPRSGTTLLHALICTSPLVNDYVAECSYFRTFLSPYFQALESWDVHTRHWFKSKRELKSFHVSILESVIGNMRATVGDPEMLALKDPLLTPYFHHLADMFPAARFIVIARDPRDSALSYMDVHQRLTGLDPTREDIENICDIYNLCYQGMIAHYGSMSDRSLIVNYNELVFGREEVRLSDFGIADINADLLWKSSNTNINDYTENPWSTRLYGQGLRPDSADRHRDELSGLWADLIVNRCGDTARQLGLRL